MIVHEVPRRLAHQAGVQPTLSQIESVLNQDLRNYFKERIVSGITSGAFGVSLDEESSSPTPGLVSGLLLNQADFIASSQAMAQHLITCQSGGNPEGLLAVATCKVDGHDAIAILKMEKEAGVRVTQTTLNGLQTFSMQHLHDLMLTQKTRLYKIAVFISEGATPAQINGVVADKQRGIHPRVEVADFFLKKFLGCELQEEPAVTTKRFFTKSQEFINTSVSDPEKQARYEIALLAALNSPVTTLNPTTFAFSNIEPDERGAYLESIGFGTMAATEFTKDNHLISTQLKRIQMNFESGISLIASPEVLDTKVDLDQQQDGTVKVSFEDKVKGLQGKR